MDGMRGDQLFGVCYPGDVAELLLCNKILNDDDDDRIDLMESDDSEIDVDEGIINIYEDGSF